LVVAKKYDELRGRLLERMEFGTAGLRSRMGAGYSMMNDLTILQTTQGFLKYLQGYFKDELSKRGVVIGYDGRHNSSRFAEIAANIFVRAKVPVYLFSQITPTPFVVRNDLKKILRIILRKESKRILN
jgi:phosphoglucomutase / phosphopentomutase